MKLHQNAKEMVLVQVDGLGLLLGEIRYNRQTETVLFALEKAAFFDLYFPCAVIYDQQQGPVVRPHIMTTVTSSSIRIQRSKVSCFVLEADLNTSLVEQYNILFDTLISRQVPPLHRGQITDPDDNPDKPQPPSGPRVVPLRDHKDKK